MVSADGHPVGGTVIFTVRAPVVPPRTTTPGVPGATEDGSTSAAGSPAPGPPTSGGTPATATARIAADAQAATPEQGWGGGGRWGLAPWAGAGAILVVLAAGLLRLKRRGSNLG